MPRSSTTVRRTALFVAALVVATILAARFWPRGRDLSNLPRTEPALYRKMVSAFTIAATMLRVDLELDDSQRVAKAVAVPPRLVPEEPAAWANLGLAAIRLGNLSEAAKIGVRVPIGLPD